MQEIHLLNTNQLFTNTTTTNTTPNTSIDRRLRHTHLQNQALKCPRCDSLNTKFCYYNNYNLSQPRHFCKSCRRYWTKGGVLRNVPIGGGCRKSSKRSSASVKESKLSDEVKSKPKSNNSNSSSESSSMTGNAIAAVGGGLKSAEITPSALTPPRTDSVVGKQNLAQVRNPNFSLDLINSANLCCETGGDIDVDGSNGGGGFADFGSFSTINNETTTYNFDAMSYDAVSAYNQFDRPYEQWQLSTEEGLGGGYMDPTVQMDHDTNTGSEPLILQQEPQQQQHHMFGFTPAVDQGYWSQQQWSNNAHHLYLP